jgi:ABC-type uncharacterized transport system ATPase subunit
MTVHGIVKIFGDQQVLADVSFELASGEILGLIGANGAGKTTLLECVAGLLSTDDGEVRWRGSPLPRARRKERLFYVPECSEVAPRVVKLTQFDRCRRTAGATRVPTKAGVRTPHAHTHVSRIQSSRSKEAGCLRNYSRNLAALRWRPDPTARACGFQRSEI